MQPKHNNFPNNSTTATGPPASLRFSSQAHRESGDKKEGVAEKKKREGGGAGGGVSSSVPDKNTSLSQRPVSLLFNLMADVTGNQRAEP